MARDRLLPLFLRAKALALAALGAGLMMGVAPIAAVNLPASFPMQFLGGCSVIVFFLLGAQMTGDGLSDFERLAKADASK